MPTILWTRLFLQDQGYASTETVVNQDNQSAILLENHGNLALQKGVNILRLGIFTSLIK